MKPVQFSYAAGGQEVINNGHAIQVNYAAGSSIKADGIQFDLKQFHFHSRARTRSTGSRSPRGAPRPCGQGRQSWGRPVLFAEGKANRWSAPWSQARPRAARTRAQQGRATGLLPADRDYYRYNGSLPRLLHGGVRWIAEEADDGLEGADRGVQGDVGSATTPVQPVNRAGPEVALPARRPPAGREGGRRVSGHGMRSDPVGHRPDAEEGGGGEGWSRTPRVGRTLDRHEARRQRSGGVIVVRFPRGGTARARGHRDVAAGSSMKTRRLGSPNVGAGRQVIASSRRGTHRAR